MFIQQLLKRLYLLTLIEHSNKGNLQQIQTITFYDRMQVRSLLQHVKAWGGPYGKLPFPAYTNQHSRAVKGGALKMLCVCFVGSNPTAGIHPEQDVKLLIKLW